MSKYIVGAILTLLVVTHTGRQVVALEWQHVKQLTSTVVNGVTR